MDSLEHIQLLNQIFRADRPEVARTNQDPMVLLAMLANEVEELKAPLQSLIFYQAHVKEPSPTAEKMKDDVAMEVADVALFFVALCDLLSIDILESVKTKSAYNSARYSPVELFDGSKSYAEARAIVKQGEKKVWEDFKL